MISNIITIIKNTKEGFIIVIVKFERRIDLILFLELTALPVMHLILK